MTFRIAWVSPMTPASGIGTFSHAVTEQFPASIASEPIDLTILHPPHPRLHRGRHRAARIAGAADLRPMLSLFDLVIYNTGNNSEHHGAIYDLLSTNPGVVISHDYVYQHYLAERSLRGGGGFAPYAALLARYGDGAADACVRRSRITSRTGQIRYSPWDSEYCVEQPLGNVLFDLASALVVHSAFAETFAKRSFRGPVLRLGMPCGQKRPWTEGHDEAWRRELGTKRVFHMVSFGHIQPTKAIDLTISAIAASPTLRGRLRYTVAGFASSDVYLAQLRDLIASHALDDVVRLEIDVPEGRLDQLMGSADLFINLRKPNTEASSASLIEQLETGRPVVVLDSGCYAEVPAEAALKLPPDVSVAGLADALAWLLDDSTRMAAMGRRGRRHATGWSCASYAEALVRFALEHKGLLRERALAVGIRPLARAAGQPTRAGDEAWCANLATARRTLAYLDHGILALDPGIILGRSREELCRYVAEAIFGVFGSPGLQRALARFFAGRTDRAVYWACARFALVADAVLSGNAAARQRLRASEPCYDPEFWGVMEHLAPRHFIDAGLVMLADRMPDASDHVGCDADELDGFPTRLRLSGLLRDARCWDSKAALPLKHWLEHLGPLPMDGDLPILNHDLDWIAGGSLFRAGADLSGFFPMEPDHVWSRGPRAFVGLRLGPDVSRIELLLRHINADAQRPCKVELACGGEATPLMLRGAEPAWIGLDLAERPRTPIATTWIGLWAERAAPPTESSDTRLLGLCVLRLRLKVGEARGTRASTAGSKASGLASVA